MPSFWASFTLEAPAYALAVAALLPLLLRGQDRLGLCLSALVAVVALSIKLTAAFGLVVPFIWLLQKSPPKALVWGVLTVALTVVSSLIWPSWSWTTMSAVHLQSGTEASLEYRMNPDVYAHGWLVCMLAVVAVANRYVANRLTPIVPWLSAAVVALAVHFFHHPYWGYYSLHLVAPLAVLGAIGIHDLLHLLGARYVSPVERWVATIGLVLLCVLWGWQRTNQINSLYQVSNPFATSPIVKELRSLGELGQNAFSMDPIWTFAAGLPQTPPELTIVPLKRIWSGQMNYALIAKMLASNHVAAIVISKKAITQPAWSNLLSGYSATAQSSGNALFVRNDLNPKPIDLDEERQLFRRLGL